MRRSEKKKSEKKEDAGARKGKNVAIHSVFPMICGSEGSKSRLGAEPCGQMRDEKLHAFCGAKHISQSKCKKHLSFGSLFEVAMSKTQGLLWREAHL